MIGKKVPDVSSVGVLGVDFTSSPTFSKAIVCAHCQLSGSSLLVERLERLTSFDGFTRLLEMPGPWIAGLDFPFGQPRRLIDNLGWPANWEDYVSMVRNLGRPGFRDALEAYKSQRPDGDREHLRLTDRLAGALSPSKLYGVPVALMFFEGAQRLRNSSANIIPVRLRDSDQVVVEAYPALVARALGGRKKYKAADPGGAEAEARAVRAAMVESLVTGRIRKRYGVTVKIDDEVRQVCVDDSTGDSLDSIFAAVQAAWAWTHRAEGYGVPDDCDPLEGWIVDPHTQPTRNSSVTRVRPVFREVFARDASGRNWLPYVLGLVGSNPAAAAMLANVGEIPPAVVEPRPFQDNVLGEIQLESCFERPAPAGLRFLRWLVENPDRLTWPRDGSTPRSYGKNTQECREKLIGKRGAEAQEDARRTARRALEGHDAASTQARWWVFEGATEVDCCIETDSVVLVIEGKRTESLSESTEWYSGRNQLHRNLEAARDIASGRPYGVIIAGEHPLQLTAYGTPEKGLPHLSVDERAGLMTHFLGFVTWRQICDATGVDYDALPNRVARRVQRPTE